MLARPSKHRLQVVDAGCVCTVMQVLQPSALVLCSCYVTPQVAIRTTHWTVINHALIWGTLALWLPFLGVLQALCGSVSGELWCAVPFWC